MPLIREGHLYGFMLCGQVRAKYQEYKTIIIDNEYSWMDEPKIKTEWSQVAVVDNNTLVASANLLNFIIDNFEAENNNLMKLLSQRPVTCVIILQNLPDTRKSYWQRCVISMRICMVNYPLNP